LWFLARNKRDNRFRDRRGETLFIDARKMGILIDRVHRELTDDDLARIAGTYHAWRGDKGAGEYGDTAAFCKNATFDEIAAYGFALTPGRYVGTEEPDDEEEAFGEKIAKLSKELERQFAEGAKLEAAVRWALASLAT
jgi:type I restriction enzyme M protein